MKNIMLYALLLVFSASCQSDTTTMEDESITGTWKLTELQMGWTGEVIDAESLEYEEYYTFSENGDVKKYRSTGEEALGSYSIKELSDGKYVEVVLMKGDLSLKESCAENENLKITDKGLSGGSLPCDGPGLTYVKVSTSNN